MRVKENNLGLTNMNKDLGEFFIQSYDFELPTITKLMNRIRFDGIGQPAGTKYFACMFL